MGTPPPMSGQAARPRAATPLSRRPFAFGTRVTIVLLRAVYRTRVPSRGPGESIVRSWRPRAKFLVAKDKGHDALGWRHGVGLLEKYSRPCGLLIFRRRHRGRSSHREIAFGTRVTIVLDLGLSNRRPKSRSRSVFARRNANANAKKTARYVILEPVPTRDARPYPLQ